MEDGTMEKAIPAVCKENAYNEGISNTPTLKRVYTVWTASAYQVLMMASWTCNIVLYSTVFDIGGPMMLIYSTVIVTIGQTMVMASLAELCSIWPRAGGQQVFTKRLAPASAKRILSYLVGWTVLLGEVATAAGCAMNNAQILSAIITITHPSVTFEHWQVFLLYAAFLILSLAFCFSQKHLPLISVLGGIITVGGAVAWATTFLVLAEKQSARFVFATLINNSGYTSSEWVGIMSFYTPIYALYGTDGILHIAEEMENPERNAPRAMIWSMIFSGVTSCLGAVVMAFCAGDWQAYLEHDAPFIDWFIDVLNTSAGGIIFILIIIVLLNFLITVGINTAASRMAWGFACDNALPFSARFRTINRRVQSPMNTIMLVIVMELIIGLVIFGSDYAFQVIVSLGGVAIQIGYLVPIVLLVLQRRRSLQDHRIFDLGRFGWLINLASACWTSLIVVVLFFPIYVPITSENLQDMNWSVVVFVGVVCIALVDWVLRGRFSYTINE